MLVQTIGQGGVVMRKKALNVMVDESVVDAVDKLASKLRVSRATLLRNLILSALDDLGLLDSIGVVPLVGAFRNMQEKGKGRASGRLGALKGA